MAEYFHITLDGLLRDHSLRLLEEAEKEIKPVYTSMHQWQKYSSDLAVEYRQCLEEGLDVSPYEALFSAADKMRDDENRSAVADILFKITRNAPMVKDYPFEEPPIWKTSAKAGPAATKHKRRPLSSTFKSRLKAPGTAESSAACWEKPWKACGAMS